ncbi:phenylacetate--CoA ligase family protein [Lysinibacillus sp. NPDC097287]|uniref:phenylacetate--CoA ligase family protein n=1 Tax=Lysinibacillus sp. NPDC097287 TaxID=3364144 RepID=UPI003827CCEE
MIKRHNLVTMQQEKIKKVYKRVLENVPFYKEMYSLHNLNRDSLEDFTTFSKVPFLEKKHFKENYPIGLLAVPKEDVVRYHASSGTSGLPTMVAYTKNDIEHWSTIIADSLKQLGITKDSIVQNAYGYGMFTGGLGFHHGIEKLGATVIPASTGNTEKQVLLMKDLGANVIAATPSYLLHIYDYLVKEQIPIESLSLEKAIVGAEPWTEEMRKKIQDSLKIKAYDVYGMSEAIGGGVAIECEYQDGLHIYEDGFYAEIIDPKTGELLPLGEEGELVLTSLEKEALPIVRYRTGDITSLIEEPCKCGNHYIRMKKPTGRADDMLIIKGVNVFPSQIESVLLDNEIANPHYQIIVERVNNHDILTIRVEVDEEYRNTSSIERLKSKLYSVLGIKFKIELLTPLTLERTEGKAKRLIDLRNRG